MTSQILVAGATGRTGRHIVRKLIQAGSKPRALARVPIEAELLFGDAVETFEGDVRSIETLHNALTGIEVVISAVGTRSPVGDNCPRRVDYEGIANLVTAARQASVRRFVLISSIAVTHADHPLNQFGHVLDWKRKGEEVLENSGLVYTIIRPGGLKDTPGDQHRLRVDQGDRVMGTISREDVAEACLKALTFPAVQNCTFEIIETGRKGQPDWQMLYHALTC